MSISRHTRVKQLQDMMAILQQAEASITDRFGPGHISYLQGIRHGFELVISFAILTVNDPLDRQGFTARIVRIIADEVKFLVDTRQVKD